ncbi:MAG: type III secretion system chaperone [Victivallales bacterium]|nr:type III secretion system chaperone [Victivallales bacterium]
MTDNLQRLAEMAKNIAAPEEVTLEEFGFSMDAGDTTLSFFAPDGNAYFAYCRAKVGDLGDRECPDEFAESALKGNFFWRGTEGATLSLNTTENAIYLTDRFDDGAFENEESFRNYINDFLRTLFDWQENLNTYTAEKEVAK